MSSVQNHNWNGKGRYKQEKAPQTIEIMDEQRDIVPFHAELLRDYVRALFRNLRAETKAKLKESRTLLVGFSGEVNYPIRTINLSVTMGKPGRLRTMSMEFEKNIQTDEKDDREDEPLEKPPISNPPEKVVIHEGYLDQTITIGGNLNDEYRFGLIKMLRKHVDAFAWTPTDMIGIPCSVAEHELKTYPHIEPTVQRKRIIAPDKRKVVKDKVRE
ncbi:hypothetical protein Tco_0452983 [Tanacetum coccineum]